MSAKVKASEIVITRIFNAPREKVWKAWTEPKQIMKWWGPENFTSPDAKVDLRVGGKYLFCMRGSAGSEWDKNMWSGGEYREIVPMEKIVCTDNFTDEHGNVISPADYGMTMDWPEGPMTVTVIFEDAGAGKTKVTIKHKGHPEGEMSEMAKAGWTTSLDKLEASLKD